jgi:hypothetical protein
MSSENSDTEKEFIWEPWGAIESRERERCHVSREEAVLKFYTRQRKEERFSDQYDKDLITVKLIAKLSSVLSAEGFESFLDSHVRSNPDYTKEDT